MKNQILLVATLFIMSSAFSQLSDPVKWSFTSKKVADGYEIHLKANVEKGWHIYSQYTSDEGPVPTSIRFNKNPLVTLVGKVKEVGKMETKMEPLFGVEVKQFNGAVDFVQTVKVKGKGKTSMGGTIEFMLCDDHRCLPPTKKNFTIALK